MLPEPDHVVSVFATHSCLVSPATVLSLPPALPAPTFTAPPRSVARGAAPSNPALRSGSGRRPWPPRPSPGTALDRPRGRRGPRRRQHTTSPGRYGEAPQRPLAPDQLYKYDEFCFIDGSCLKSLIVYIGGTIWQFSQPMVFRF